MHMPQLEKVGRALGMDQDLRWCERKEKGGSDAGGAKQTLVRVLESLECEKSAEHLRVGEQKKLVEISYYNLV